jgi:hypothetical protein
VRQRRRGISTVPCLPDPLRRIDPDLAVEGFVLEPLPPAAH